MEAGQQSNQTAFLIGGLDWREWLDLLKRRRTVLLEVGALIFLAVLVATLAWPPWYEATAEILVQNDRAQLLLSPQLQAGQTSQPQVVANPVTEQDLNSEREILTSLFLLEQTVGHLPHQAVRRMWLGRLFSGLKLGMTLPEFAYETLHRTPRLTPEQQRVLKLHDRLWSASIRRSHVIEIGFWAHDAGFSKLFLDELLKQYLLYHASLSEDPQARRFFMEQAELLRRQLYASEDRLRDYETQNGVTDVGSQQQALVKRLSALELERSREQAQLAGVEQKIAALTGELRRTPQQIAKQTDVVQNLALQQLKPQVLQLEAQRAELLTRYQPSSRRVQEVEAKLNAAMKILNSENRLEVKQRREGLNPVWVTLDSELDQTQTTDASLKASLAALLTEIAGDRSRLNSLGAAAVVVQRLQQEVATRREAYLSYLRKAEEARAAGGLNVNHILNVSVVQAPLKPLEPSYPKLMLNLAAGLLLGLLAGVFAAWREEELDPCVNSAAAIRRADRELRVVAVLDDHGV